MQIKLNDNVYNVMKWVALIALPAIATLYSSVATIWGLPFVEEVPATVTAVDLFLGALLGLSSLSYDKETDNVA